MTDGENEDLDVAENDQDEIEAEEIDEAENDGDGDGGESDKLSEVEQLAADMGWAPQDQWRGSAEEWVDAKTFIRTGRDILRNSLRRQDGELAQVRDQVTRMTKMQEKVEERAYERAKADLEEKRRAAVADGDVEAYESVSKEIDDLPKPEAGDDGKTDKALGDPAFDAWQAQNNWYGTDPFLTAQADLIAGTVKSMHPNLVGADFYAKITEYVKEEYPQKFGNPARKSPSRVEGGGNRRPRGGNGKKTFADLPADAKAQCDEFVKDGLMDRDEYVESYFEQEGAAA